ncbi:hypothetical protein EI981_06615 [Paenibacillus lutimineralis]|uniref:Uncharacterized protein n=1 Tax=Paenibacillus lutimineralis TaxID=2707005 RepID=A0A3Q9I731_9BACL|nr:beta-ketoacyl synthase N-terminal-like domain-containing protein [Paenibacillus lutimineralis]AZS14159.1 hypothetical protein EI981_06615 [Paenibacillus lutimineralis]
MKDASLEISQILKWIKQGEIDPEEGYARIKSLKSPVSAVPCSQPSGSSDTGKGQELMNFAVQYLKQLLSQVIGLEPDRINAKQSLEDYGVDSVAIMEINALLDKDFANLPKTLMFEYGNLHDLATYFMQHHRELLEAMSGLPDKKAASEPQSAPAHVKAEEPKRFRTFAEPGKKRNFSKENPVPEKDDGIAIIGISGVFPNARNLDEFWSNLKNGVDCISEIPAERWDHSRYYDPEKGKKGKVYSKWGGFIDEYNCFDPLFFQLTPRDAEQLDPQERLFLECAHSAIEDGGYTRQSLWNTKTGVFVGVMYGHYQLFGAEETAKGNTMTLSSSYASIANRVSYFFNFGGPSIALDTMCSSSLTAVHLACESIHRGDSELAIAGGVNVTIHPDKYLFLCNQRFASSEGKCRAFGSGGDGYVPGEGVGAILLKPLAKAIEDGDNIHGIIRASSINHGGKTNGYTVPNPNAQSSLISESLLKSGIHPRAINYIEAHGTGTSLGDPIEISGLTKAFRAYTTDKQYCAIGSVKSNVGHLESAAGVVSIIKVLLQMKHRQLVPSLHSEVTNPNIDFEDTPFYVQHKLEEWEPAVIQEGGLRKEMPRYASVSSFGAGGTNVHIILEEYAREENQTPPEKEKGADKHVFVLSAKNGDRLNAYAKRVLEFIERNAIVQDETEAAVSPAELKKYVTDDIIACFLQSATLPPQISAMESIEEYGLSIEEWIAVTERIYEFFPVRMPHALLTDGGSIEDLADYILDQIGSEIASKYQVTSVQPEAGEKYGFRLTDMIYTLQTGREMMEERLAIIVSDIADLKGKLEQFLAGKRGVAEIFSGNTSIGGEIRDVFAENEKGEAFLLSLAHSGNLSQLCRLWCSGIPFNWRLLSPAALPARISLPTYPFDRTRYWFNTTESVAAISAVKTEALNTVLDSNESVFEEQCYKKTLTAQDAYLRDHVVQKRMVLPGVVYLEMAWRAGMMATRDWKLLSLSDVSWRRTLELPPDRESQEVFIGLASEDGGIDASIYSINPSGLRTVYCTCTLQYGDGASESERDIPEAVDIEQLIAISSTSVCGEDCYREFSRHGMDYGVNLRVIDALYSGVFGTLSRMRLPEHTSLPLKDYVVHPGFADGAMQTALYSVLVTGEQTGTFVPFSLQSVTVYGALTSVSYCLVSPISEGVKEGMHFDLLLMDESGTPTIRFQCLSGRDLTAAQTVPQAETATSAFDGYDLLNQMLTKLLDGETEIDEVERMLEGI